MKILTFTCIGIIIYTSNLQTEAANSDTVDEEEKATKFQSNIEKRLVDLKNTIEPNILNELVSDLFALKYDRRVIESRLYWEKQLHLIIEVVNLIDPRMEAGFDPDDRPLTINVVVGSEEDRKQLEKARNDNSLKAKHYGFQMALFQNKDIISDLVRYFLTESLKSHDSDFLRLTIEKSVMNEHRRIELLHLFDEATTE